MGISIWNNEREKDLYDACEINTDKYFNDLYEQINDIEVIEKERLTYREGQHNFALDVMDTIRNKKLLLIQAGVGIGKSYGYLIPTFYTYKGIKNFNKIVISTSSIALQHQLLKDIDTISKMLDIKIDVSIAKGIKNYACIKRIESHINSHSTHDDRKEILKNILSNIEKVNSCDRSDLESISENVWNSIQLSSRGYCSNCTYITHCEFHKLSKKQKDSNIIITNHANYINNILTDGVVTQNTDMVIFDEAHKLEENIINVNKGEIKLAKLFKDLQKIYNLMGLTYAIDYYDEYDEYDEYDDELNKIKYNLRYLFSSIKRSAEAIFNQNNRNNHSVIDGDRMQFKINKTILSNIEKSRKDISMLLSRLDEFKKLNRTTNNKNLLNTINLYITKLEKIYNLLNDMKLGNKSKNLYWVSFFNIDSINLGYVKKDHSEVTTKIFSNKIPIVCTSATMLDNYASYKHFMNSINLDKMLGQRKIELAEEHISPFDYDNHALFYYDPNISIPNNYDDYIIELSLKISELIRITEGKSLILFTSKKCMKDVYDLIKKEKFPFRLILQGDEEVNTIRQEFEIDTNSCLFATGAFWEGIDVKGNSLSNLIITHLPFDIVDALSSYKASKYVTKEDKFKEVYIPNMLIKLEQAIGRLIRSYNDTGIVSCLDSRIENYLEDIKKVSPIKNFTTNMKDVYEFSDKLITNKKELKLTK